MALPKMHQMRAPVGRWHKGGVCSLVDRRHKMKPPRDVTGVRRAAARRGQERRRICECPRSIT